MSVSATLKWLVLPALLFGSVAGYLFANKSSTSSSGVHERDIWPVQDVLVDDAQDKEVLRALELQLAELRVRMAELEQSLPIADSAPERWPAEETVANVSNNDENEQVDRYAIEMAAMGLSENDADSLKQRYHQFLMEDMRLRDKAQREGMQGTALRDAMLANSAQLRNDLGDEDYDRLMYALGRPNRLEVVEVMMGSPAFDAGVEQGDLIIGYDGQRVFSAVDLKRLIAEGDAGETVAVDVQRDDTFMQFYVQRGPVGIYMNNRRIRPD